MASQQKLDPLQLDTPRITTQMTNRSRSSIPQRYTDPMTQRQQGDVTERGSSNSTMATRKSMTGSKGDLSLTEAQVAEPEATDLPFFTQDQFTDVILQVGGKKLYTCRALLAWNSPVMAKVLSSGSSKNKDLDLPEKEYEDVVELLAYIDPRVDYIITERIKSTYPRCLFTFVNFPANSHYLGSITRAYFNTPPTREGASVYRPCKQSAIALLPLAEEYEISSLKILCEQTIMTAFKALRRANLKNRGAFPVEISIEYLHLADKYEFPKLRNLVVDEFVKNDDSHATKTLMASSLISEHVKLTVLHKKVEKTSFELDKERRERTAIETKLGDYGHKRFQRPLP